MYKKIFAGLVVCLLLFTTACGPNQDELAKKESEASASQMVAYDFESNLRAREREKSTDEPWTLDPEAYKEALEERESQSLNNAETEKKTEETTEEAPTESQTDASETETSEAKPSESESVLESEEVTETEPSKETRKPDPTIRKVEATETTEKDTPADETSSDLLGKTANEISGANKKEVKLVFDDTEEETEPYDPEDYSWYDKEPKETGAQSDISFEVVDVEKARLKAKALEAEEQFNRILEDLMGQKDQLQEELDRLLQERESLESRLAFNQQSSSGSSNNLYRSDRTGSNSSVDTYVDKSGNVFYGERVENDQGEKDTGNNTYYQNAGMTNTSQSSSSDSGDVYYQGTGNATQQAPPQENTTGDVYYSGN